MGFLNGRITFTRFRVSGPGPLPFNDAIIEQARARIIDPSGAGHAADGIAVGWAGGDHVLDLTLDPAKNIIEDALHMSVRIDTDKIPGSLLRAYTRMETDALARNNPSGFATKAQRQEAKESARVRAEAEASDGRFRRMRHFPILWDGRSNVVYAGTNSAASLDRLRTLFRETFDRPLEPITAGTLAYTMAETRGLERTVEDHGPALFLGEGAAYASVAWADSDSSSRDFLGNEFLLWLWHTLQSVGDTLTLPDGSEVTVMLAKTLTLDCPRGETGRDTLTDEGPTRLPEAFRALQAGKLPRKAGLIVVRDGVQYEFTLQAETLAVGGASIPRPEGVTGHDALVARVEGLRHLVETLDLLYDSYGVRRTGPGWSGDLGRIRLWLQAA